MASRRRRGCLGKLIDCLLYWLEQGEVEKKIIEQCMRESLPLPAKIANAPSLQLGLQMYWSSFMELSSCRPTGWGVGPIPWDAMRDYAREYELTESETTDFKQILRAMDNAYLEYERKKSPAKPEPKKLGSKGGRRG